MNFARAEAIADAVLYEGYMLYPYRRSALKNRFRWTFGVLHPDVASRNPRSSEQSGLQSECLLTGDLASEIKVKLRFLQPIASELCPDQDASVREVDVGPIALRELAPRPLQVPFQRGTDPPIEGALELEIVGAGASTYRLRARVRNLTSVEVDVRAPTSDALLTRSMVSTQLVLSLAGGEFISPRDPPEPLREAAERCQNRGLWPILVGKPGERDLVLCSPIILEDYPRVAPESPGDLFDGTEIDELLTLRILTLTPQEKREMAAAGERTAALLRRTEAIESENLARLHGARRSFPSDGRIPRPGDRVRLRPRGRADIFDLALTGRIATIVSVEQDYDGRSYVVVTIDDDPGRDFGAQGQPGHRFFFSPEEVELLGPGEDAK